MYYISNICLTHKIMKFMINLIHEHMFIAKEQGRLQQSIMNIQNTHQAINIKTYSILILLLHGAEIPFVVLLTK